MYEMNDNFYFCGLTCRKTFCRGKRFRNFLLQWSSWRICSWTTTRWCCAALRESLVNRLSEKSPAFRRSGFASSRRATRWNGSSCSWTRGAPAWSDTFPSRSWARRASIIYTPTICKASPISCANVSVIDSASWSKATSCFLFVCALWRVPKITLKSQGWLLSVNSARFQNLKFGNVLLFVTDVNDPPFFSNFKHPSDFQFEQHRTHCLHYFKYERVWA